MTLFNILTPPENAFFFYFKPKSAKNKQKREKS